MTSLACSVLLTGGAVKINIAAFKCFKFSVFLSSSSDSSVMVIWMEDCLGVSVLLTAPLETCDVERRNGHEEAMTLCTRLLIFISFTLPWLLLCAKPHDANKIADHLKGEIYAVEKYSLEKNFGLCIHW